MPDKLKIVMVAAECVPFAKTGGLADVVGALPGALAKLGHEVIVIMPKYGFIDTKKFDLQPFFSPLGVWMGDGEEWCAAYQTTNADGIPVYFIEADKFFDRSGLYHDADFNDYADNPRRFAFLSRAALQLCKGIGFEANIVHAHDWHTALAPAYLKIWHWDDPILGRAASFLTIHNIGYQGVYDAKDYPYTGLQPDNFVPDRFEDHGQMNYLKGGIHYADVVSTVSPGYARETLTPAGGQGLAPYLNNKGDDYLGILNGVDYSQWDPAVDALIPATYSSADLSGKAVCKRELQRRFNLEIEAGVPLVGVVSRFADQKGLDLLAEAIETIVNDMRVQFVILGSGDKRLESYYGELPFRYPGKVGSFIGYSNELAHWIEAGADFFVMPSRYEPCGLNQIYSIKYGTLPIVRATGGLDDTVEQYDEATGAGTGFKFWKPSAQAIYYAIGWAVSTYYDRRPHFEQMQQKAMRQRFSWEDSAREYEQAYRRAIVNKMRLSTADRRPPSNEHLHLNASAGVRCCY
ncbi:MAG: glycogen synthase GlgA [Chloroflexi bacterium]|nr:glycogen synthase GlgA [Chloroflexota bacterium]